MVDSNRGIKLFCTSCGEVTYHLDLINSSKNTDFHRVFFTLHEWQFSALYVPKSRCVQTVLPQSQMLELIHHLILINFLTMEDLHFFTLNGLPGM